MGTMMIFYEVIIIYEIAKSRLMPQAATCRERRGTEPDNFFQMLSNHSGGDGRRFGVKRYAIKARWVWEAWTPNRRPCRSELPSSLRESTWKRFSDSGHESHDFVGSPFLDRGTEVLAFDVLMRRNGTARIGMENITLHRCGQGKTSTVF